MGYALPSIATTFDIVRAENENTESSIQTLFPDLMKTERIKHYLLVYRIFRFPFHGEYKQCPFTDSLNRNRCLLLFSVKPKVIKQPPRRYDANVGDELSIKCIFEGKPKVQIIWSETSRTVIPEALESTTQDTRMGPGLYRSESTLSWASGSTQAQRRLASGTYRCTGRNDAGEKSTSAVVLQTICK